MTITIRATDGIAAGAEAEAGVRALLASRGIETVLTAGTETEATGGTEMRKGGNLPVGIKREMKIMMKGGVSGRGRKGAISSDLIVKKRRSGQGELGPVWAVKRAQY